MPAISKESELLQRIKLSIDSRIQERFDELVSKRQDETIKLEEHQELLRLTNEIEKADAERIKLLIKLAQIRQTTLEDLIADLKRSDESA